MCQNKNITEYHLIKSRVFKKGRCIRLNCDPGGIFGALYAFLYLAGFPGLKDLSKSLCIKYRHLAGFSFAGENVNACTFLFSLVFTLDTLQKKASCKTLHDFLNFTFKSLPRLGLSRVALRLSLVSNQFLFVAVRVKCPGVHGSPWSPL